MKRLQSEHTAQKHEYEHTQAQVNAVHDDLTDLEEQRRSPDVTGHYAKKDQERDNLEHSDGLQDLLK